MSDATHARVRTLYHPEMTEASAAALTWYFRNVLFFETGLDRDARVRLVRYENLVTAPEEQFRTICGFLGIPFSPRISSIVTASSIRKNPPPTIEPSVRQVCDELANRFDAVLEQQHDGT